MKFSVGKLPREWTLMLNDMEGIEGNWAGQLGDGRAITGEVDTGEHILELQLKGLVHTILVRRW